MFETVRVVVFDCDGTLWLGSKVIEGAVEITISLKEQGCRVFFLTNNSGKSREQIINKLNNFGFEVDADNVYCGSYALARYLKEKKIFSAYLIGSKDLEADLLLHGIGVENSAAVPAVVVGFDRNISYEKISVALEAIRSGAKLVVANADPSYPVEDGRVLPGCGAMVGAIVGATGHEPDFIVGKPNTFMLELLCQEHELTPKEVCVVGDMPESDIVMARNFGCQNILFDPENVHKNFSGTKIKKLRDITSLLRKED